MLKDTALKVIAALFIVGLIVLIVVVLLSNYISAFKQGGVAAPNITAGTTTGYVRSGSSSHAANATAYPGVPYPPSNMTMGMGCPPPETMPMPPGSIVAPTMQIPVMPMPEPSMQPPEMKPTKKPVVTPKIPGPGIPVFTPQLPQMGSRPQVPQLTEYERGWQNVIAMLYEIFARMFNMPYAVPSWNYY